MNEVVQQLISQAERRPLGNSWTYATQKEFAQNLINLTVEKCTDIMYNSEELTVGQGYTVRKKIRKHFGVKE